MPLAVGLAVAPLAGVSAPGQAVEYQSSPQVLVIGYTTFEAPAEVVRKQKTTLQAVTRYLGYVSELSRTDPGFQRPLNFDVVLGNYYQIYTWILNREIDGAVVSPFVASLLRAQGAARAIVEFPEATDFIDPPRIDGRSPGHWPLIAAYSEREGALADPLKAYEEYLESVYRARRAESGCYSKISRGHRVAMVAHLSASGFVAPVLRAARWLTRRHPDDVDSEEFWGCFFENTSLRFDHAHELEPLAAGPETTIYFSYSGRGRQRLERVLDGRAQWRPYDFRPGSEFALSRRPPIPNDLLVFRRDVTPLFGEEYGSWVPPRSREIFPRGSSYTDVQPVSAELHEDFAGTLQAELGKKPLEDRWREWYQRGRFGFTIPEVQNLLRLDQTSSGEGHLALVLPGGGVKSAYQAKLIDMLYSAELLRNARPEDVAAKSSAPPTPGAPLVVREVVGTSGGAMVGLFTALKRGPEDARPDYLTSLWVEEPESGGGRVVASAGKLFPRLDLLRWVSIYVILVVILLLLYVYRQLGRLGVDRSTGRDVSPVWVAVVFLAVLVVGPVLMSHVAEETLRIERLTLEGALFAATSVLCHLGACCCLARRRAKEGTGAGGARRRRVLLWPLVLGLAVLGGVAAWLLQESTLGSKVLAVALILAPVSVLVAAREGSLGLELGGLRRYAEVAILLVFGVLLAFGLFSLISVELLGWSTPLELTVEYWLKGILPSAGLAGIILLEVARKRRGLFHRAFSLLSRPHYVGRLGAHRALTLLLVTGLALGWWNYAVAPALYDSDQAVAYLDGLLDEAFADRPRGDGLDLWSRLIVTASSTEPVAIAEGLTLPAGDLYFCFDGHEPCPASVGPRWFNRESTRASVLPPVFASGSPFPVFPPYQVPLLGVAAGDPGVGPQLIDGGYVHNVPLEAAALAGARQALVIRSAPLAEPRLTARSSFPGQLTHYTRQLLPFLFARAQELDRMVARDLFVASLTPALPPEAEGPWPWLADFRPRTVRRMVETAGDHWRNSRRIGQVESWGRPVVFRKIREDRVVETFSETLRLTDPHWTPEARATLMKRLAGKHKVAVFDFDNTCIRNDIGEAVLLRMILDLDYAGERDDFWALFPDAGAAGELRAYWRRHHLDPGIRGRQVADQDRWESDYRDYVVQFYRQYELQLEDPRVAYGWAVQLLMGKTEAEVAALTRRVWREQLDLALREVEIRSPSRGSVTVASGIRVYPAIRELIAELTGERFEWDVWVISASSKYSVAAVAGDLGVKPDKVVGMRLRTARDGRLLGDLELPVTYREGKRRALRDERLRPELVAGDSMTDFEMLMEAEVALVIDRGRIDQDHLGRLGRHLVRQPADLLYPNPPARQPAGSPR